MFDKILRTVDYYNTTLGHLITTALSEGANTLSICRGKRHLQDRQIKTKIASKYVAVKLDLGAYVRIHRLDQDALLQSRWNSDRL